MVITWKSDVYHLLIMCHAHIKIWSNFSTLVLCYPIFLSLLYIFVPSETQTHTRLCIRALRNSAYEDGIYLLVTSETFSNVALLWRFNTTVCIGTTLIMLAPLVG